MGKELRGSHDVLVIGICSEFVADTPEETTAKRIGVAQASAGLGSNLHASGLRSQAMGILSEEKYF